jgi:hypothetical protein
MRRLLTVLLVALVCTLSSGVLELIVPEPCATEAAASGAADGNCPPTCLQCHCARPFDVTLPPLVADGALRPADPAAVAIATALAAPDDVLHVPRPAVA